MMPRSNPINIEFAVTLYYERIWLESSDINQLFNISSSSTLAKYRNEVIEYFKDKDISPVHRNNKLDTWLAYEAWGLNIENLEKRLRKLQKIKSQ